MDTQFFRSVVWDALSWSRSSIALFLVWSLALLLGHPSPAYGQTDGALSENYRVQQAVYMTSGGRSIRAVTYGQGMFVAVGESLTVLISRDGTNWLNRSSAIVDLAANLNFELQTFSYAGDSITLALPKFIKDDAPVQPQKLPFPPTLRSITFGQGKFVAVGDAGLILASSDGERWTATHSGTDAILTKVIWGASGFVAVGGKGTILHSTDGLVWLSRTQASNTVFFSVCYGAGQYVAVGDERSVMRSTNAVNWMPLPETEFVDAKASAFGNNCFLAIEANTDYPGRMYLDGRQAWKSAAGQNWEAANHPTTRQLPNQSNGLPGGLLNLVFHSGKFWALSTYGMYISDTGEEWLATPDDPPGFRFCYRDLTSGAGRLVAARESEAASTRSFGPTLRSSSLAISSNGLAWTPSILPRSRMMFGSIADRNTFHCRQGMSRLSMQSKDGITWTFDGKTSLGGTVKGNQLLYVHSTPEAVARHAVLYTEDGITWKRLSPSRDVSLVQVSRTVSISPTATPSLDSVALHLNGQNFLIRFPPTASQYFALQASTNLQHWTDLTILTNSGGQLNFADPEVNLFPHRFYRLKALP